MLEKQIIWLKEKWKQIIIWFLVLIGGGTYYLANVSQSLIPDTLIVYKNNNMTIEFINNDIVIGQALLKSHKTYDEVLEIASGEDRVVIWYEFSKFDDIKINDLGEVEFIDMREKIFDYSGEEILDESEIEKYIIPNPNYLLPVTKEYRFVYLKDNEWILYNSFDIPKENITIGVQTYLGWGEYLDVVLNVMGNKLDMHAVVMGTSAGFVTEAPTGDPNAAVNQVADASYWSLKDTSPSNAGKIVEIGWYSEVNSNAANFEVGIYDHNSGNDEPKDLIAVYRTNAKGTVLGWKTVTVDIEISGSTIYWIAFQVDDTAVTTYVGFDNAGIRTGYKQFGPSTLPSTFDGSIYSGGPLAIYAVWEAAAPADTCTCPASPATWNIDSDDNCFLNTTCDIYPYETNLYWKGSGAFNISATGILITSALNTTSTPVNMGAGGQIKLYQ